ncbi:HTH-type transcriptional activator Btr [Tenacibaculum sp. 190524A02b]|uniref:HTH-type transcriptional activator Btr n=1 Tax=Tenacibaculum vairaonense TaxID=3137860 RepID=A0ABP1FDP5_9FLAO
MNELFDTFKPQNSIVKKYVDYYYLDIKPDNVVKEIQTFPHFNNIISFYKSDIRIQGDEMVFHKSVEPNQVFTPIREKILTLKQFGRVHGIVIVFHTFGIQQFFRGVDFSNYVTDVEFFSQEELQQLFSTKETNVLTNMIDKFLEKRFIKFENLIVEKSLRYIFNDYEKFSITEISKEFGVSRQHLTRVFKSHLGISLKRFHKIVILRKTIHKRLFQNSSQSFTDMAYEFNFSDQSHLIKTYKELTKCSPKSFFEKGTLLGKNDTFWHLDS